MLPCVNFQGDDLGLFNRSGPLNNCGVLGEPISIAETNGGKCLN